MQSLAVLADPTRQRIVEMLAAGALRAGEIASRFDVSAPAISCAASGGGGSTGSTLRSRASKADAARPWRTRRRGPQAKTQGNRTGETVGTLEEPAARRGT
ncbi:MAG: hypothetical protein DMF89_00135 [Acidobacteria bacterium]|nr:MAG: hypothetical protein DMF89_00135 [Acidobacteriota bacterium]